MAESKFGYWILAVLLGFVSLMFLGQSLVYIFLVIPTTIKFNFNITLGYIVGMGLFGYLFYWLWKKLIKKLKSN